MSYVLIIMLVVDSGQYATTQTFSSKETCETARELVTKGHKELTNSRGLVAVCTPR